MGVVLAAMLHAADVTGDATYSDYTLKNFDFIFDHLDYFRKQAKQFGPQAYGYRRLIEMRELDDCGAIGAALIKAYNKKRDPRYRATIDAIAEHIAHKQFRMPDGTLARQRPQPVSLWADDFYMSVPFLAQMGVLTGERSWFDDGARQVIQRLGASAGQNQRAMRSLMVREHRPGPEVLSGAAGSGWVHDGRGGTAERTAQRITRERERVLEIFRRGAQGVAAAQRRHRSLASIVG